MAIIPTWGVLKELDRLKVQLRARFANTVVQQTRIYSLQEKSIAQETRVWKREKERFIAGVVSQGRWRAQALTSDHPASKRDT